MLVTIFLVGFFLLGLLIGPLLIAVLGTALSDDRGHRLSTWSFSLGLKSIYRPAITFNAADELTLKKRSYDEKHDAEYIAFGGVFNPVKRYLHDPQNRIHSFYGVPFGFVDELFGLVVDPRDVALGRELHLAQENDVYEHRVEKNNRLHEAVLAVFDLPRGGVGVRLPDVSRLVGGSFDSQVVDRIRDYYETGQSPKASTTALRQLLVPLGTLLGVILLGMFIAGQGIGVGGGGGGGPSVPSGNSSTISVGSSLLVLLFSMSKPGKPSLPDINWRDVFVGVIITGLAVGFVAMMLLGLPIPFTLLSITLPLGGWALVMFAFGLAFLPFFATFIRAPAALALGVGKLYVIIGLLRFDRPVFTFDGRRYRIVEYADADWAIEPKWYRFAFSKVGIGFQNDESNWPEGTAISPARVDAIGNESDVPAPAPPKHTSTDLIATEGIHGFVPNDVDDDSVYVRTDRSTGWFFDAGQDIRLMTTALEAAKQDLGGGRKPVSERWILGASIVMAFMGLLFNWVVFF